MGSLRKGAKCGSLISTLLTTYVAAGFILIMLFAFYMTLLISPELLHRMLQHVIQCQDFPGYVSLNSTRAGIDIAGVDRECSDDRSHYSKTDETPKPSPAAAAPAPAPAVLGSQQSKTMATENDSQASSPANKADRPEKVSVVVGVLTIARTFERRQQVRLAYAVQSSDDADFTVRFVLGALEKEEDRIWVEMENATFGDIVVLPCEENMNKGKTFTYFTTLVTMGAKYDYVMKTDDDSYVRLSNLGKHLSSMPRTDLYYGYDLRCDNRSPRGAHFFAGAGYLISWDLVLWINSSPIPRRNITGAEDVRVGDWFRDGGVAKNRPFIRDLFYDYIDAGGACARNLTNDVVLVHKLKSTTRWEKVLAFFEKDLLDKSVPGN